MLGTVTVPVIQAAAQNVPPLVVAVACLLIAVLALCFATWQRAQHVAAFCVLSGLIILAAMQPTQYQHQAPTCSDVMPAPDKPAVHASTVPRKSNPHLCWLGEGCECGGLHPAGDPPPFTYTITETAPPKTREPSSDRYEGRRVHKAAAPCACGDNCDCAEGRVQ